MSFVFTEVWNATFEGLPPDTENINLGAGRIRNLKVDIRQRMVIDHQWAGNAFDGKHLQVQLPAIATPPALDGGDGCVFASNPAGPTELFYRDSSGNTVQLTSNGSVASPAAFPAGTRLLFENVAPPAGWIQITGVHDYTVRIVGDSSGQTSGGTWVIGGLSATTTTSTTTGTTTNTSTTTSTTTGTSVTLAGGVSVLGHAIDISEMPSHTHNSDYPTFAGTLNSSGSNSSSLATGTTTHATSANGGGAAHTHGVSNTMSASATSNSASSSSSTSNSTSTSTSFSSTTVGQDGSWRPAYVNFCLGQKT
jgi:hypothetical protein